uniref:Putative ovule protein n=1 Tax=Solanum chacoense TaxID=4108 RepID=A0A0V0HYP1_SOLCH
MKIFPQPNIIFHPCGILARVQSTHTFETPSDPPLYLLPKANTTEQGLSHDMRLTHMSRVVFLSLNKSSHGNNLRQLKTRKSYCYFFSVCYVHIVLRK